MTSFEYLMILCAVCFAALLIFFGAVEHYKVKHNKRMEGQARLIWVIGLVFVSCAVVTGVQVFDFFWVSPSERLKELGMR